LNRFLLFSLSPVVEEVNPLSSERRGRFFVVADVFFGFSGGGEDGQIPLMESI
jgi:hypothetical protein